MVPVNRKSLFLSVDGSIRLLIATTAFGMGVDFKRVQRVVDYGPSKMWNPTCKQVGLDIKVSRTYCITGFFLITLMDI